MQGEAVVGFSGSLGKEIAWIGGSFKLAVDFDGVVSRICKLYIWSGINEI